MNLERPHIVLVHGALTDASVWDGVIGDLQQRGFHVTAPTLPLRGLASDAAYLESVLATIPGPAVLAGHSWGGQVISQSTPRSVKALVYVAAFQPDEGEAAGELNGRFAGSQLGPQTIRVTERPGGQDLHLAPEHFRAVYAGDLSEAHAARLAARQCPIAPTALEAKLIGRPGWRTIPSWMVVTTADRSLPPALLRFTAERAGSRVVEVDASHAVPISRPDVVAGVIVDASTTSHERSMR